MFNDTVTIINHYLDTVTRLDRWNKTVLKDCMWQKKITKSVVDGKIQIDDSVSLTIPYRGGYLSPKQYAKIPNDQKINYWTLNSVSNLDIVVLGEVKEELTENYTITNVKKDYDEVATISGVSDNTRVDYLKHWKVDGK